MGLFRVPFRVPLRAPRLAALAATLLAASCTPSSEQRVTLFAASSLTEVVEQLVDEFEQLEGIEVAVNFGSSGRLAQQIERADRADLFFAAALEPVQELIDQDLLDASSLRTPIGNQLVFVESRHDTRSEHDGTWSRQRLRDELTALADRGGRIAIGHPGFVPAGSYAWAWLERQTLAAVVEPQLVLGNNVRDVVAQVTLGAAELGMVYRTDAMAHRDDLSVVFEVPPDQTVAHYGIAVRPGAPAAARQLLSFLTSDRASEIYRRAGFLVVATS